MKRAQLALAGMGGMLVLGLTLTAEAQVVTGGKPPPTLKADVIKASKQKEEIVDKVFKALGPAFLAQLRAGRQVELPGVGTFRIVRVSEYKDLVGGRPAVIPAKSYVEFTPAGEVLDVANAPDSVPATEVKGYEFRVNPQAFPGTRDPGTRMPIIRTR